MLLREQAFVVSQSEVSEQKKTTTTDKIHSSCSTKIIMHMNIRGISLTMLNSQYYAG